MTNLLKGVQKIRRSYKLVKDESKAVKSLQSNSDPDVKAVLKSFDGNPSDLLKKIKALKGSATEKTLSDLGLKLVKSDGKKSDGKAKKISKKTKSVKADNCKKCDEKEAKVKSSDKEVEIQLITPTSVSCPDTDGKGNDVVLVVGKDGLFGCGVLGNSPKD